MRKGMSMYGQAAVEAVRLFTSSEVALTPKDAWVKAIARFTESQSSRDEVCPRSAFLGLCEAGLIKGIPAGTYTQSKENKEYAIKALKLLLQDPKLADDPQSLWSTVAGKKAQHGQMAIAISLLENGLIHTEQVVGSV